MTQRLAKHIVGGTTTIATIRLTPAAQTTITDTATETVLFRMATPTPAAGPSQILRISTRRSDSSAARALSVIWQAPR